MCVHISSFSSNIVYHVSPPWRWVRHYYWILEMERLRQKNVTQVVSVGPRTPVIRQQILPRNKCLSNKGKEEFVLCIKGECFWLGQPTTSWVYIITEGEGNVWGTCGGRLRHLVGRATDALMGNVNLLLWHRYTEACHNSPEPHLRTWDKGIWRRSSF